MTDNTVDLQELSVTDDRCPTYSFEGWIQQLIEKAQKDLTAPYASENLLMLVRLKYTNRASFEGVRDRLGGLGIKLGRFDEAVKQEERKLKQEDEAEKRNVIDAILDAASEVDYFHTQDGTAYADVIADAGHRETWPIQNDGFERWMRKQCYMKLKSVPSTDSLNAAINTLAARAIIDGEERPVCIRTGILDGKVYIDLCDDGWRAIEVDKDGYRIVDAPPVRFRRKKGMRPLPVPQSGGKIDELRSFLNVKDNKGFVLVVAWLLMALRGHGPYPILVVVGEQGTAKSTLMSLLRQLVDPHSAPLRTLPRDVRDLFIAANNALVLAFDNLSYMSDWISDGLCRLSTGGGFATRALNTDDDEKLFDAMRPILMNGIENVGTRGDLVDRAIVLLLDPIPEEKRKTAVQLQTEFDAAYPRILGALLDMMVHGLRMLPSVHLERPPRMADFALWATACETAGSWKRGTFLAAYEANRAEANEDVIAASALATAICSLLDNGKTEWSGTATELLEDLNDHVDNEHITWDKRLWPQTGRVLSERLNRVAPALRRVGVVIERHRGKGNQRLIRLLHSPEGQKSAPPAPCAPDRHTETNGKGSSQTITNDGKRKKTPKFATSGGSGRGARAHRAKE